MAKRPRKNFGPSEATSGFTAGWEVLFHPDFAAELRALDAAQRKSIIAAISVLKELRVQIAGRPWRALFAFNRRRQATMFVVERQEHRCKLV